MSRYRSRYSYYDRRPSRWPWFFAFLLLVVAAAAALFIFQRDSADRLLEAAGITSESPTATTSAQGLGAPTASSTSQTVVEEPTNTTIPRINTPKPTEADSTGVAQAPTNQSEATAEQAADQPTTAPTVQGSADSPVDAVQLWADRWGAGDYDGLFDLFTSDAMQTAALDAYKDQHDGDDTGFASLPASQKRQLAHDYIVGRYQGIRDVAGLTSVKVTVSGQPNLDTQVPIHVEMKSSKVGDFAEDNQIQLRKEGDTWKVEWTPALIFKDLGDGCVAYTSNPVKRGSILDRNGDPLAYDTEVSIVGVIPGQLENESATIKSLAQLIGMTVQDVKDKYSAGQPTWFMPVKTYPSPLDDTLINGLSALKGVVVQPGTARIYPLGAAAAHITGYVTKVNAEDLEADTTGTLADGDVLGRAGIEAAANDLLSGKSGGTLRVVECSTRSERATLAQRPPVPAQDLILTIDSSFQKQVDAALGDVTGSTVVLDPRDGSLLALASHPNFDPNWFIQGLTDSQSKQVFDEKKTPLLNRALQSAYPTGSIFKVITMATAMQDLDYTGESEINCPQEWSIPDTNTVFRDWTDEYGVGAQGLLTLHNALVQSCNTVFYELGYELDKKDQELLPAMTKAFGLGAPTGIPYLQEIAGTVPDPQWKLDTLNDYWATGDAVNLAIGQGYLLATPIQMANTYTTIANGGHLLKPFIVEFTKDEKGKKTRVGKREVINELPVSDGVIDEIQSALRDQTSNSAGVGSSKVFGDFEWPIAGKTGTAENQANSLAKPHAWFAAFGPYGERSTISSIVMIESSGEGVQFAAPRTRQIYEDYLKTDLAK